MPNSNSPQPKTFLNFKIPYPKTFSTEISTFSTEIELETIDFDKEAFLAKISGNNKSPQSPPFEFVKTGKNKGEIRYIPKIKLVDF